MTRHLELQAHYLFRHGRYGAAAQAFGRIAESRPDDAAVHFNLGCSLQHQARLTAAAGAYRHALDLDPKRAGAWNNLGQTLIDTGDLDDAAACLRKAIHLRGDRNAAAGSLLSTRPPDGAEDLPAWHGEPLAGRRLLIFANRGIGDAIEQVRHVPEVWQRGGEPVLHCQAELAPLFAASAITRDVMARGAALVPCDAAVPLSGLRHILHGDGAGGDAGGPYLRAEPARAAAWRAEIGADAPAIGLVWAGNASNARDAVRSMAFAELAPLLAMDGARFFALQVGRHAADGAADPRCTGLGPRLNDFAETAAVIAGLDLVICVDTAIAHLAGAMGRPVWVLLGHVADPRWTELRPYASVRLFRRAGDEAWAPVVGRVAAALDSRLGPPAPRKAVARASAGAAPDDALVDESRVRLKRCRHGLMLYPSKDAYVGRSLDLYGEYSEGEVTLFRQMARPASVIVEVGANVGAHTVFLARAVGAKGFVMAFEPQRVIFQMLAANLALNGLDCVRAVQTAVGRAAGTITLPAIDYRAPGNFGGVALGGAQDGTDGVPVVTIDSLGLPVCHVIKIDAEGMEADVLAGADATIRRLRPQLYVENDRAGASANLIRQLFELDYRLYWHLPRLYSPDNFFGRADNVFGETVSCNMLGLPREATQNVTGLKEVTAPDQRP